MKKITKKFLAEFEESTKGDAMWTVISFDKETGIRKEAYIAYEFFSAFSQMTYFLAAGLDVVLTNADGYKAMNEIEHPLWKRATYKQMLPYAIRFNSEGRFF